MLGSRGFKGVEVQGQLEAHNDAVRQHQDGRLYTREFRVLTARTRADSIMRPRVLPVGPVPKTITRRCPSYYTHTWWQHEPLWRPQPVPPLTQTQAHWRKLYQFACDLAPFLGTSDRTTLARALDRQCPRGTPFHGSLNRSAKVFDPELFPQTQARVGGLERLRLCHFVADGGLAVCPPLHALLRSSIPKRASRVAMLLDDCHASADVVNTRTGANALHVTAGETADDVVELIQRLHKASTAPFPLLNGVDHAGATPIHIAARVCNVAAVEALATLGARIDTLPP
jgi:hypothetical protein